MGREANNEVILNQIMNFPLHGDDQRQKAEADAKGVTEEYKKLYSDMLDYYYGKEEARKKVKDTDFKKRIKNINKKYRGFLNSFFSGSGEITGIEDANFRLAVHEYAGEFKQVYAKMGKIFNEKIGIQNLYKETNKKMWVPEPKTKFSKILKGISCVAIFPAIYYAVANSHNKNIDKRAEVIESEIKKEINQCTKNVQVGEAGDVNLINSMIAKMSNETGRNVEVKQLNSGIKVAKDNEYDRCVSFLLLSDIAKVERGINMSNEGVGRGEWIEALIKDYQSKSGKQKQVSQTVESVMKPPEK